MEAKELKITIPENQEIDWQESAKQEKIVFKKKEISVPRSWKEYCENHKGSYYFIGSCEDCKVLGVSYPSNELVKLHPEKSKHTLPTKELAEAFLAMMQLMSLRQAWIGYWKPDWSNDETKHCIIISNNECIVDQFCMCHQALSFPTEEMATDFMNTFKELLEIAKPLI